jgi:Tol biopolymer transport system component
VQILAPQDEPVGGLAFSPDENYVYYTKQEEEGPGYSVLFQVPSLGGPVRKLIFDIDSAVTFSPDGSRIAFTRGYPQKGESALMMASVDGSGEHPLAILKDPDSFQNLEPSWSPDGRWIAAVALALEGGFHVKPVLVDSEDGSMTDIGEKRWFPITGVRWLPDGSGLAIAASEQGGGPAGQIWLIRYPGGETHRITNDLNFYEGVSITAAGDTLATIQMNRIANLWVAEATDVNAARQITSSVTRDDTIQAISPAPDGSVLFVALDNDKPQIWRLDPDGRQRTRLTRSSALNLEPSVSRDGSLVAFTSLGEDGLPHIWTMALDGGLHRQVTNGAGERLPAIAPDGSWIAYVSIVDNSLWRTPAEGGSPERIIDRIMGGPKVSPDGARVVVQFYAQGPDRLLRSLKVVDAATRTVQTTFPFPAGFNVRWHPDGESLTFLREGDGMFNVWRLPLDGGEPTRLTALTGSRTFSHSWSPDGKRLYLTRGETTRDVVLITGFR